MRRSVFLMGLAVALAWPAIAPAQVNVIDALKELKGGKEVMEVLDEIIPTAVIAEKLKRNEKLTQQEQRTFASLMEKYKLKGQKKGQEFTLAQCRRILEAQLKVVKHHLAVRQKLHRIMPKLKQDIPPEFVELWMEVNQERINAYRDLSAELTAFIDGLPS